METGPIWSQLLLQVVLIALNAFFASAELAILSVNENKLRMLADDGDKKAEQLLVQTDLTGYYIAESVGITNYAYFCRMFKKAHRVTPTQYRESFTSKKK